VQGDAEATFLKAGGAPAYFRIHTPLFPLARGAICVGWKGVQPIRPTRSLEKHPAFLEKWFYGSTGARSPARVPRTARATAFGYGLGGSVSGHYRFSFFFFCTNAYNANDVATEKNRVGTKNLHRRAEVQAWGQRVAFSPMEKSFTGLSLIQVSCFGFFFFFKIFFFFFFKGRANHLQTQRAQRVQRV